VEASPQAAAPELAPLAPGFAPHPPGPPLRALTVDGAWLSAVWEDGASRRFYGPWLREYAVGAGVDPVTRERGLDLSTLEDAPRLARAEADGTAVSLWWEGEAAPTRHPVGWLRDAAEGRGRAEFGVPAQESWEASTMPEPVSFDGPAALEDDEALRDWLIAARRWGLARLRGLGSDHGAVQRVAERIGVVRSSSFGFLFDVESKPDPDSAAYTADALTGHTDLPTREMQPGLQLLHCRENTCSDGLSTMADGFALAAALRSEEPETFEALTTLRWVFTNRHRGYDYRQSRPIIELGGDGAPREVAYSNALRAEPDMADEDVPRAYAAVKRLMRLAASPRFLCRYPFAPGDLVIFDNRRILHGRDRFTPQSGTRRLQGCYLDTDELLSRLRVLERARR